MYNTSIVFVVNSFQSKGDADAHAHASQASKPWCDAMSSDQDMATHHIISNATLRLK